MNTPPRPSDLKVAFLKDITKNYRCNKTGANITETLCGFNRSTHDSSEWANEILSNFSNFSNSFV